MDVCTVVSIYPFAVTEVKPGIVGGRYQIPAAKEGDFVFIHIFSSSFNEKLAGTSRSIKVPEPAERIAKSLIDDFTNSIATSSDGAKPGIFWVGGKLERAEIASRCKDQLVTMREIQMRWYIELVKEADSEWERFHNHKTINDMQRHAARVLGLDKEKDWVVDYTKNINTVECPMCKSEVKDGTVKCPHCGYIINNEIYEKNKARFA